MSTRCVINFCHGKDIIAKVYRHCDGYPKLHPNSCGVDEDLNSFFDDVISECHGDNRFDDPSYLAAKFVVWQADKFSHSGNKLNFLSVGVLMEDPSDIEYRWFVDCKNSKRPNVRYEEIYSE